MSGACQVILRPGGGASGAAPDAGPSFDASSPSDGGSPNDAGSPPSDAGSPEDGGVADTGLADAGFIRAGPESQSEVWIAEFGDTGGSTFTALARVVDESGATFVERFDTFQDLEGGRCLLAERRQDGGSVVGYRADRFIVRPNSNPDSAFNLLPRGSGLFTPDAAPSARLFAGSTETEIEIRPSGAPDSLLAQVTEITSPPEFSAIAPLPGVTVSVVSLPTFRWLIASPPRTVIVEIYDEARQVVLSCPTADDGTYTLAPIAASAFLSRTPAPPLTLEVRRDVEVTEPIFARSGVRFEGTFRLSWGVRYDAQ